MDESTDDTRLPADIDAQPLVQAAVVLQPVLRPLELALVALELLQQLALRVRH